MKAITHRHASLFNQQVLANFILSGQFERHMCRSRTRNAQRRQALLITLDAAFGDRVRVQGENAGLHVLAWFRNRPAEAGLLLGYSALDEYEIVAGVNALVQAFR